MQMNRGIKWCTAESFRSVFEHIEKNFSDAGELQKSRESA
jgi:hypothetical protein